MLLLSAGTFFLCVLVFKVRKLERKYKIECIDLRKQMIFRYYINDIFNYFSVCACSSDVRQLFVLFFIITNGAI